MKHWKIASLFTLIFASLFFYSCDENTTDPVDDNPRITSVNFNSGYVGLEITINGTNFGGANDKGSVQFGGVDAPDQDYTEWTATKIRVKVPTNAKSGKLVVINQGKKSNEFDFVVVAAKPEAPKNLMATSVDDKTVFLSWEKSPQDNGSLNVFGGYVLTIQPGAAAPIDIAAGSTSYSATNLTEGVVYTFTLASKYVTNVMGDSPVSVQWSPASRFSEISGSTIKVYETNSSLGSGLDLYDAGLDRAAVYNVANGAKWNLGLDTRTAGKVIFGPATSIDYNYTGTPQKTEMSQGLLGYYLVDALNEATDAVALNDDSFAFSTQTWDLNTIDMKGKTAVVFVVRVEESAGKWNYAKVMVKKIGGQWLQGTADNRYLEVVVSYQKIADVPYAKGIF